ncbi:GDP dissociation inhibitor [Copromyces sp. CBS 386.78]|nr:GDP dissociation inhibitor [Copromyces sp. CBS 386.78]
MAMGSISDTLWDVVICGTGLQQSLLALSLSRSGKNILHIDPNDYYGGAEAAFSLQEAESWVDRLATEDKGLFRSASITNPDVAGLSFPRAYSLALAPQLIHARSELLSQLVSSRAYRQVEFLAVGSFYIFKAPLDPAQQPSLVRIPSTREDVFSTTAISAKAKRGLMKFLKFVLDYDSPEQRDAWKPFVDKPLVDFLQEHFKMDAELKAYIIALTLSLDGRISTEDGLSIIYRHLTSMGHFGPGFAALYPKWGGISEIAQVACRAGAVGGAVYMLGAGIKSMATATDEVELELTSGDKVKTKLLVRGDGSVGDEPSISRLVAVVGSPLKSLFESTIEGAPTPCVAVVALPAGSLTISGAANTSPVYVFAHSSGTGECPNGQSVLYLSTMATSNSKEVLSRALESFLSAVDHDQVPQCLYQLYYEQAAGVKQSRLDQLTLDLPGPSLSLSMDDSLLKHVREAWKKVVGDTVDDAEYMVFTDREPVDDDDFE